MFTCVVFVNAQPGQRYVLQLADKSNNQCNVSQPQQFLSAKSIERRSKQGIAIDSFDLPITSSYLNQIEATGVKIIARSKWLNLVVVQSDSSALLQQAYSLPFVKNYRRIFVDHRSSTLNSKFSSENFVISASSTNGEYGTGFNQADMISAPALHKMGFKGAGITIAVLDNGFFNVDRLESFNNVMPRIKGTWDFVADEELVYNKGSHGTYVLSCIAANLPGKMLGTGYEADFYLFVTEDNGGETILEEYNWAEGAETADSIGVDIFSTSLGYTEFDDDSLNHDYGQMTGDSTPITKAANIAASRGILVINSAGNEGQKNWKYIGAPADGKNVLSIGAVDDKGKTVAFSSYGPNASGQLKPEVCTKGAGSAVIGTDGNVGTNNGTSFSCPIMSGGAACLWQAFPNKTAAEVKLAIEQSARAYYADSILPDTTINFLNPDTFYYRYGYGIPDLNMAYWILKDPGIFSLERKGTALAYPNPFTDKLWLAFYSPADEVKIAVYDVTGNIVLEQSAWTFKNNMNRVEINNVAALQAGNYVVKLICGSLLSTVKVVKVNN
jgi:serine protease AprX